MLLSVTSQRRRNNPGPGLGLGLEPPNIKSRQLPSSTAFQSWKLAAFVDWGEKTLPLYSQRYPGINHAPVGRTTTGFMSASHI